MSNIKDLFGKNNIKVLPGKSLGNLVTGSGVESAGYIESTDEEKLRFEPYVDYSIPKSFARYGSAEKYYTDTIDYIINRYPYDGSGKEKANWYLSSSYFDNYLFENEYPRTNGFINLGINYGSIGGGGVSGYEAPTVDEYIYFKGGPHTASAGMIGKPLPQTFTGSNYYKDDVRESNLELNAPIGNSAEFWFKKDGYDSVNESEKQIFVDVWNSASIGNTYGRFRVECDFGTTPHQFSVAYQSGTTNGFLDSDLGKIGQSINLTGSTWNHYALTFANVGSNLEAKLYVNGNLNDTIITGSIINKITGSMLGWIGAMGTSINSPVTGALGYAKLSGSMDEFRFWKSSRTETEVGRYWFTQVNAGSNTDLSNVDLGVYYKFNEGIVDSTAIAALDTNVLDYSGRITNGSWTGYVLGSRDTGSAMVISKAALSEFKDPIIYPSNPLVSVFRTTKKNVGYDYDVRNNSGIYTSIPEYITGDPQEIRGQTLKNLTQIIGSYFDDVQLQIESLPKVKNVQYTTGSQKIAPFINRFLSGVGLYTPEIFADASALEYYASRDDFLDFSKKLNDTKNRIYENIYNNLVHVFKTKGTENSFRNLMRCYGVDEPLMKISLYGDETTQELRTNSRNTTAQKTFVDFNNVDRFDSTVYQQTSSTDTNTRNFITASSDMQFIPKTMQAEAIFPKKFKQDSELYFRTPFLSCSLFGAHTPTSADQTDLTWATNDWSNFQVYAVRTETESDDVYFKLTSSAGGVIPLITSSVYTDVYANTKWNLAVRIKPDNHYIPGLSGSEAGNASVEFVGYNSLGDNVENNFYLTASISLANASAFLSSSTRVYAGSHRTNFTGSSIDLSDAKISSVRYWIDDLPNEAIEAHSKDASAFGPLEPHKSAYLVKNTADFFQQIEAPQAKTLSLSWTFDTVTGSSDSSTGSPTLSDANFFVPDLSSGSTATTSEYGWLGPVVNFLHSGKGDFFLPFDTNAVNREYVYSAKQLAPEILNSSNMVEVRTQDDELFTRETRPQNYFYAIEKSQSAIISEEMMKWFATIKDFNFLIGDPVNRYRQEYKPLAKLREVYFRSVGNTIDFERFVDFFKWVDDSLSQMLMQLVPASANFAEKVRTMIESHVLERNKYWSKFPTLEMKLNDPEAGARGIVEGTYPWKRGHAPIPLAQDDNCYWANNRASASVFPSGDTEVDAGRNIYRLADDFRNGSPPTLTDISSGTPTQYQGSAYAIRNFTKTYLLKTKEMPELKGGTNVARIKNLQYAHTELPFGTSTKLTISSSQVQNDIDCNDVVDPNEKVKLRYKLTNNPIGYKSGNGNIFAPFDLYSSSVTTGYVSILPPMDPTVTLKASLENYHNDTYGSDNEIPIQGPFTEKYVGGREYRHVPFATPNSTRPEAWNLDVSLGNKYSFNFDGVDSYLNAGNDSAFGGAGASFSMGVWLRAEEVAKKMVVVSHYGNWSGPATNVDFRFYIHGIDSSNGRASFEMRNTVGGVPFLNTDAGSPLNDGLWHFVCFGYSLTEGMFLSVDGSDATTSPNPPATALTRNGATGADLLFGNGVAGVDFAPFLNGNLDNVSFWSKRLTSAERTEIYNSGCSLDLNASSVAADLVSWWRMGDSPGDSFGLIYDAASGGNNATGIDTTSGDIVEVVPCVTNNSISLTARTAHQPRSTILREPLAKRPINIRNIKQTTGSTIIGNYSHQYEVLQTSGRKINNRFFVKNNGFVPEYSVSSWVSGLVEYALPDFSKYGATKNIFVERFNAPGGPDVSSRGVLDLYAEEYAIRNDLNQRNMVVRGPLNEWSTEHCGQFGIKVGSTVNELNYNTSASYFKVNRNPLRKTFFANWSTLTNVASTQNNRVITKNAGGLGYNAGTYDATNRVGKWGTVEFTAQSPTSVSFPPPAGASNTVEGWVTITPNVSSITPGSGIYGFWSIKFEAIHTTGNSRFYVYERGVIVYTSALDSWEYGSKFRIRRSGNNVFFEIRRKPSSDPWSIFYSAQIGNNAGLGPTVEDAYYVILSFGYENTTVSDVIISNPQYDNWFVQHAIPRSDLQYAWINNSYNNKVDQPWGHAGSPDCGRNNFSVPSGSSESMAAPAIQYVSASNWGFTGITDGSDYAVNFVNMLPMLPTSVMAPESYKYGLYSNRGGDYRIPVNWAYRQDGMSLSAYGKTLTWANSDSVTYLLGKGAAGLVNLDQPGYLEFKIPSTASGSNSPIFMVALVNKSQNQLRNSISQFDAAWLNSLNYAMDFQYCDSTNGRVDIYENGIEVYSPSSVTCAATGVPFSAGWRFRFKRKFGKIEYQYDLGTNGKQWMTFYESGNPIGTKTLAPEVKFFETTDPLGGSPCTNCGGDVILEDIVITYEDYDNLVFPGPGYYSAASVLGASGEINSYFNNLNGPYGYPSWKQIRTGEHPVARYQKNNNIISFKKEEDIYGSNEVTPANAGLTRDTLIHFTTPPVTFRYKPVGTTLILSGSPDPLTLNSVYGNNMGGFPNPDINNFLGTSIKCEEQMFDRIKGMYHNAPSDSPVQEMLSVDYSEIVYPREIHAGLKEYRQRTEYAEVANGTNIYSGGNVIFVSASLSNGSSGIDRGPLYRRTFWRNDPVFRNRRSSHGMFVNTPSVTGTLPNSQGYSDAYATSVNGWGTTPIIFVRDAGGFSTPATDTLSGSDTLSLTVLDYPDCGELNSPNYQTLAGYAGTSQYSEWNGGTPTVNHPIPWNSTWYPTASCYYYHQAVSDYLSPFGTSSLGMKWRVAELSGKNPWFDTYEDYVQDIRGTGKSFTIIPEFRISQHMDYYADGLFRKQNDQFLTLDGATITSSAVAPISSDLSRGFDKQFFSEYSNTDFQKYFGKFDADNQVSEITLKCNGIKKLLPYHGFYPSHRTLQVASLFSQSIAPYIGGLAWASGTTTNDSAPPSGALAVQSLLQPYYAPGILYNTIKAGIACDWAAYTGSAPAVLGGAEVGYLVSDSNYRIPFESILDPLSSVGCPQSASSGEGKLNLLYPSYQGYAFLDSAARTPATGLPGIRSPYIDLEDIQRARAVASTKYNQYRLAINNLLAEIPSFFLKDNELKTIVSKPAGDVSLVSGSTYYMDVYLEKDPSITMIQDYWNGFNGDTATFIPNSFVYGEQSFRSFNGRYFGPAVKAGPPDPAAPTAGSEYWGPLGARQGDPAYAPYTPPYFYGKSVSTIAYVADKSDESGGFNYKKVFEKATVTQTNPTMKGMFTTIDSTLSNAPALSGAMGLSSSLNLFGLFSEPQTAGDSAGNLISATNNQNPGLNKWVISPRMETPVLDFSTQPEQKGWGRGMWSGYGNILTSSNGITFGIEETFKGVKTGICEAVSSVEISWTNLVNLTSSLLNTKLEKGTGVGWTGGAAGPRKVEPGAYITCVADDVGPYIMFGLNGDAPASPSYQDMEFAIQTKAANVYSIWESNVEVVSSAWDYFAGDSFRILRTVNDDIKYQHSSGSNGIYTTVYTSTSSSLNSILYPDVAIGNVGVSLSGLTQYPGVDVIPLCEESLLQKCFTNPEEKQVGEIASQKEISEAIVAIPFSIRGFSKESRHPETTVMMSKNFFRIDQDVFDANRQHYLASKNKIFSADPLLGQSVTKMLKMMDKYIIPPELDSLNFPEGSLKVDPFVMYMFEFNHTLSQQDLADIWQGVMPDISRIAQLSDTTVDDNVFTHPTGPNEFFGGKMIPEDIRWMVFKVKKRGNFNYYKMTADTSDDDKFNFDFNVGGKDLPYSYNWPYDFCSLVELAEIEVKDQFITSKPVIEIPGTENLGVTRILDHIKNVSSGEEEE